MKNCIKKIISDARKTKNCIKKIISDASFFIFRRVENNKSSKETDEKHEILADAEIFFFQD